MSLQLQNEVARRLGHRRAQTRPAASALFGRSVRLLDAADELTGITARRANTARCADDEAFASTVGCMSSALEALSTASLELSLIARRVSAGRAHGASASESDSDYATRLLFAASQDLRLAAEATKLAQRALPRSASAARA